MKFVRIPGREAESVLRKLIADGLLDEDTEVEHEDGYVLFPVSAEPDYGEVVERQGRVKEKKPTSLREALEGVLSADALSMVPSSFDIVGDIAVLDLDERILDRKEMVGDALLKTFPHVKVVALKTGMVSGEYRVPEVEVVAGEGRTETIHREHGCFYKLDIASCYFSPRLGSERKRVSDQIGKGERVLVMFAGVGPYAVLAAKHGAGVSAVELNPAAVEYMRWNVLRNKVDVDVYEGDVREVVPELGKFDRIVMPLPKQASSFLDVAVAALNENGIIHYYTFAANTLEATGELAEELGGFGRRPVILDTVLCGSYNPDVNRFCVDFRVE